MGLPLVLLAAIAGVSEPAPVADCGQAAFGPTPTPSTRDVRFGQFRLVAGRYVSDEPRASFKRDDNGRYRASKIAASLSPGLTARLRVARADRGNASLLYARPRPKGASNHYPRYRISDGRSVERFESCADRVTVWPGYIVVRGPRCIRLEARVAGGDWVRRRLGFGRGTCE
jgi:hypothetical protein